MEFPVADLVAERVAVSALLKWMIFRIENLIDEHLSAIHEERPKHIGLLIHLWHVEPRV